MKSFAMLLYENQQLKDELAQANARYYLLKDKAERLEEMVQEFKDSVRGCPYREFNCGV